MCVCVKQMCVMFKFIMLYNLLMFRDYPFVLYISFIALLRKKNVYIPTCLNNFLYLNVCI